MSQMILGGNGGGDTDIELAAPATKQTLEQLLLHIVPRLPENVAIRAFKVCQTIKSNIYKVNFNFEKSGRLCV